jgi:hypothetical protein
MRAFRARCVPDWWALRRIAGRHGHHTSVARGSPSRYSPLVRSSTRGVGATVNLAIATRPRCSADPGRRSGSRSPSPSCRSSTGSLLSTMCCRGRRCWRHRTHPGQVAGPARRSGQRRGPRGSCSGSGTSGGPGPAVTGLATPARRRVEAIHQHGQRRSHHAGQRVAARRVNQRHQRRQPHRRRCRPDPKEGHPRLPGVRARPALDDRHRTNRPIIEQPGPCHNGSPTSPRRSRVDRHSGPDEHPPLAARR